MEVWDHPKSSYTIFTSISNSMGPQLRYNGKRDSAGGISCRKFSNHDLFEVDWCVAPWQQNHKVNIIMRVMVTGDTASESGIGELIYNLSGPTFDYFSPKSYGTGLLSIGIILMCQDPALNLKRRIRFSKKDKAFYIDIMLDLPTMLAATPAERMKEVSQRLDGEVPEYLAKYKIEDFNLTSFIADFHSWIDSLSCSSSVHLG